MNHLKTILITGCGQGIGLEMARYFALRGYRVYAGYHRKSSALQSLTEEMQKKGADVIPTAFDISNENEVQSAFAGIEHLDALINNARFCPSPRASGKSESEWWDLNLDVTLKGTYLCCQEAMARMRKQKSGAIVNVSSVRAVIPNDPDRIPYGAAKAGQLNLTVSFAALGGPDHVRVNSLLLGAIETENLRKRITPERYREVVETIPLRRMGSMQEVCHAAEFLLENTYVTGSVLNCSGGSLMTY